MRAAVPICSTAHTHHNNVSASREADGMRETGVTPRLWWFRSRAKSECSKGACRTPSPRSGVTNSVVTIRVWSTSGGEKGTRLQDNVRIAAVKSARDISVFHGHKVLDAPVKDNTCYHTLARRLPRERPLDVDNAAGKTYCFSTTHQISTPQTAPPPVNSS